MFVSLKNWGLVADSAFDEKKHVKVSVTSFLIELSGIRMSVPSTGFVISFNSVSRSISFC